MEEWVEQQDEKTLSEFKRLCNSVTEKQKEIDELEKEIKAIKLEIESDSEKLLNHMTESGLKRLDGEHGHVEVDEIISIRQPASNEEKMKFFNYLQDKGIFYEMVNVNSRTLNSWAKKEIKAYEEENKTEGWVPPGLQSPYREFKLKIKPSKVKNA